MITLARNGLSVDVEVEAIELIIIEVRACREVEDAPELVLCRHFQTRARTLRHVEVGLVHQSVLAALIVNALHHVSCRAIVCAHEQRMLRPSLQIVERE